MTKNTTSGYDCERLVSGLEDANLGCWSKPSLLEMTNAQKTKIPVFIDAAFRRKTFGRLTNGRHTHTHIHTLTHSHTLTHTKREREREREHKRAFFINQLAIKQMMRQGILTEGEGSVRLTSSLR